MTEHETIPRQGFVTPAAAERFLGIGRSTLRALVANKTLRSTRIGSGARAPLRISAVDLHRLADRPPEAISTAPREPVR